MYILDYFKIISKYFSFIGVGENNGHTSRFLGFSIFISKTTMKEDGWLCFHDNSFYNLTTIPAILTLECIMHGRYVIYYNERKEGQPHYYSDEAIIELCELEVNGNLLIKIWPYSYMYQNKYQTFFPIWFHFCHEISYL